MTSVALFLQKSTILQSYFSYSTNQQVKKHNIKIKYKKKTSISHKKTKLICKPMILTKKAQNLCANFFLVHNYVKNYINPLSANLLEFCPFSQVLYLRLRNNHFLKSLHVLQVVMDA